MPFPPLDKEFLKRRGLPCPVLEHQPCLELKFNISATMITTTQATSANNVPGEWIPNKPLQYIFNYVHFINEKTETHDLPKVRKLARDKYLMNDHRIAVSLIITKNSVHMHSSLKIRYSKGISTCLKLF